MRIAFLGMGAMGARMAERLARAGNELTVWNRSPHKCEPLERLGARVEKSPRLAVSGADIVFSMVRDDLASAEVWLDSEAGALAGMPKNAIAVECSTLTPGMSLRLADETRRVGGRYLEAPVVGTRPQAQAGQLIFLVGGESPDLQTIDAVLKHMGSAVVHVGGHGTGMRVKLAANALFTAQVALVAEVVRWMYHAEVNSTAVEQQLQVLANLPVCSPVAKGALASMLNDDFSPLFPLELAHKDVKYFISSADSGVRLPFIDQIEALFAKAQAAGLSQEQLTAVYKVV